VIVLGAGHQGAVIAKTLVTISDVEQVTVADIDRSKLRQFEGIPRIATLRTNVANWGRLSETVKKFDLVSGALPSSLGYGSISAAIASKVSIVDTSFMPENPLVLNASAKTANVTVVPDCGVAPGLSNILVGHAVTQLDRIDEIHIAVGGLPQSPQPPMGYTVTWSIRDLIEEYTRPARIVKNNMQISVEAMSGLRSLVIPGLGELESFYTDGLRTLLDTVHVKEMDERTLRYRGHVEKVKLLRDCGFFSDEPVNVSGRNVLPKDFSAEILSRSLVQKDVKDVTVLQVQVMGKKKRKVAIMWRLLDFYDEAKYVSSMARTTAYTNVAVCRLLLEGLLKERGIIPPEKLGMNGEFFLTIMSDLEKKGLKIEESLS
jgi:lysine 6-dehydrogenase